MPSVRKSRFQLHCDKWESGCGSTECKDASKRVLCRGKIPCDLLFIGEAPGESEDVLGVPFVGPAGKLLDKIIKRSVPDNIRYAITNIVGCIPREELQPGSFTRSVAKASKPEDEQVETCAPRLIEFVGIASPRLIICVGTFARDWLDTKFQRCIKLPRLPDGSNIPRVAIDHPSFILRQNVAQQGLSVQRAVVTIADAVEEYLPDLIGV